LPEPIKQRISRLSQQLVMAALAAFAAAALLFGLLQWGTHTAIEHYCAQPQVIAAHETATAQQLQAYVTEHDIALSDLSALDGWTPAQELVEVSIFTGEQQGYHTCKAEHDGLAAMTPYTIQFADGTATAYINDLFEHRYTDRATLVDLVLFFLCFVGIMVVLIQKKVTVIKRLEREIRILEGGDLEYAITVQGQDELGELAQGVEDMRKAILSREAYTQRMQRSTNQLMTSVSHDLRTPLTALLGYLEILAGDTRPACESSYLEKCRQRAFQIRDMINDLFEYFYVSTAEHAPQEFPLTTAQQAFGGLLCDFADLLRQDDFTVVPLPKLPEETLRVNEKLVQRIFDNLLSNIRRYADPAEPILIKASVQEGELCLCVCNAIRQDTKKGTGIGLRNCEQMMLLHQGRFQHSTSGKQFTAALYFPLER